jgi:light-regulated signal transduction histidine kinase (bacteriophytochrome)
MWYGVLVSPRKLIEGEDEGLGAHRSTSDKDLSEFLLRACHDLRASVRAIGAHAEKLRKDSQAPQASDFEQRLSFILEGARKIDSLTDGLSAYSVALQIEEASFQSTSMGLMLRTAMARLDTELRAQGAEVTCGELPRVSGNPDRLAQIFEALLSNALRHRGEQPPRIHITAEKREEEWLFAVRDNGPGIDTAYLERIFRPFERGRSTQSNAAGLGLAVCRAIVKRHGGRLWADSTPGAGSVFLFTLPAIVQ